MFVFSGVTFAIGVLLYWLTTNLWSIGQQFYTIRRMPAPGSLAEKALEARRLKSGKDRRAVGHPPANHPPANCPVTNRPVPSHWGKHERFQRLRHLASQRSSE